MLKKKRSLKTVTKIFFVGNKKDLQEENRCGREDKLWSIQSSLFSEIVK